MMVQLTLMLLLVSTKNVKGFVKLEYRPTIIVPSPLARKWVKSSSGVLPRPARHGLLSVRATSLPFESINVSTSMYLVRIVFLRAMAFVHLVAFWIAYKQNKALIGDNGITPAREVLDAAEQRGRQKTQRRLEWREQNYTEPSIPLLSVRRRKEKLLRWIGYFVDRNPRLLRVREVLWDRSDSLDRPLTTMLWLVKDRERLNPWLDRIALTGLFASGLSMLLGAANVPLVLVVCVLEAVSCDLITTLHFLLLNLAMALSTLSDGRGRTLVQFRVGTSTRGT
jgi:hypothetical protein